MIAAVTERPEAPAASACEQIDKIASSFGLVADPNDLHGPGLREQLLTSYVEWLEMEKRTAISSLWPHLPDGGFELDPVRNPRVKLLPIPANTRWGNWHFGRDRFPGAHWKDFQHPLTRAAFVLWAVGAIEDIRDPLRDAIADYDALDAALVRGEWAEEGAFDVESRRRGEVMAARSPTTMEGAAAALRFIRRGMGEDGAGEHVADVPMLEAVIRFLEREDPRPEAVTGEKIERQEPSMCAIETWREMHANWLAYPESGPKASEVFDLEFNSWEMMLRCVPTSIEGLKAWTAVLSEDQPRQRIIENEEFMGTVLQTMSKAAAYLAETAR